MKSIIYFFDRLEDYVRGFLSHYPIQYGLVVGTGVVLFWRGIWHTADYLVWYISSGYTLGPGVEPVHLWWDGPSSILIGLILLLMTGVFVSEFIGKEIIITGLRGEKKLTERTEREVRTEVSAISQIQDKLTVLTEKINTLASRGIK